MYDKYINPSIFPQEYQYITLQYKLNLIINTIVLQYCQ